MNSNAARRQGEQHENGEDKSDRRDGIILRKQLARLRTFAKNVGKLQARSLCELTVA